MVKNLISRTKGFQYAKHILKTLEKNVADIPVRKLVVDVHIVNGQVYSSLI